MRRASGRRIARAPADQFSIEVPAAMPRTCAGAESPSRPGRQRDRRQSRIAAHSRGTRRMEPMRVVLNGAVARQGADIRAGTSAPRSTSSISRTAKGRRSPSPRPRFWSRSSSIAACRPLPASTYSTFPPPGSTRSTSGPCRTAAEVCNAFEHEIGISEYVLAAMLHVTSWISPGGARAVQGGQLGGEPAACGAGPAGARR